MDEHTKICLKLILVGCLAAPILTVVGAALFWVLFGRRIL